MTYQSEVLADSPLVYFRLGDEGFTDSSGNTPTLVPQGTIATGQPGPATLPGAVLLSGSPTYLASQLAPTLAGEFTAEAWYKGTDTESVILSGRHGATLGLRLGIGPDPLGGGVAGGIHFGVTADSLWIGAHTSSVTVNDDTWHHIVGVWDAAGAGTFAAGQVSIYVDGTLATVGTSSFGSAPSSSMTLGAQWIGVEDGAGSPQLAGSVAAVACYSTALTGTRISAHLADASVSEADYTTEVLADAPLAYWLLDDAADSVAQDSSGNNRDATFTGLGSGLWLERPSLLSTDADPSTGFSATGYIQVAHNAAWMNPAAFTVEAWINADTAVGERVIAARHSSGNPGWELAVVSGVLRFRTYSGAWSETLSTTTVTAGTTYHVVGTFDGTTRRLYVDGVLEDSDAGAFDASAAPLTVGQLGNAYAGSSWNFDGRIDEFAFYGTALSGTRVGQHYVAGTASGGGITVAGEPAVAAAVALDRSTAVPIVIPGEVATASAAALDGSVITYTDTDLSNGLEGIRIEGGTIHIDNTDPVVLPPAAQRTVREDVAIAYPTPDLVNGRPT